MKNNKFWLFSLFFLFAIVAQFVLGANLIDNILQPFRGIDIGASYSKYAAFIDAIIYFWFFIVLAKGIFKDKFPTGVATVVGVMLGIGMAVFERSSGFNLGMLAPIAAIIFFLTFGVMVFIWLKDLSDDGALAFSLAFILLYGFMMLVAKPVVAWINKIPMLATVLGVLTLIAIIVLIMRGVQQARGIKFSSPTKDERLDAETSFPNQEKPLERAEEVTKQLEPTVKDDPAESNIIKEEEGLEVLDENKNVLDAEGDKFAKQLTAIGKSDAEGEQKEKEMLDAINAHAEAADKKISEIRSIGVIDQAGRTALIQEIDGISQICTALAMRKQKENLERKKGISDLNDDVQKMNDVIAHFKSIDKGIGKLANRIDKSVKSNVINKVESNIKKKTKAVNNNSKDLDKEIKRQEKSTYKDESVIRRLRESIGKLEGEIVAHKQILSELKSGKDVLDGYINELRKVVKEIKTDIKEVDTIKKRVNTQNSNTLSFLKNFDKEINQITKAAASFQNGMSKVGNTKVTEDIPIKAISNIAEIYEHLINMEVMLKEFYDQDIKPFIKEVKTIEVYSSKFNDPIKRIQTSITNIQDGYSKMKSAASLVLGDSQVENKKAQNNMKQITTFLGQVMNSEAAARANVTNQTMKTLNEAEIKIQTDAQKVNAEIQNLQNSRKMVIDKLSQALDVVVDNKLRANKEFEQKAQQFKQNIAQAAANVGKPKESPLNFSNLASNK